MSSTCLMHEIGLMIFWNLIAAAQSSLKIGLLNVTTKLHDIGIPLLFTKWSRMCKGS